MVIGDDHHRRVKVLGDAMGELQDPGQRKRSTGDELHRETAMKKHGHSSDDRPVQYRGNRSGHIRGQALANADRICPNNAGGPVRGRPLWPTHCCDVDAKEKCHVPEQAYSAGRHLPSRAKRN